MFKSISRVWSARLAAAAFLIGLAETLVAAPRYESGVVTNTQPSGTTWHRVTFARPFPTPPVVVLGPVTYGDAQAVTTRVRNVTGTGFEYQLDEWDYLDSVHAAETVNYLALEQGVHTIGGLQWEAGRVSGVGKTPLSTAFNGAFSTSPVVFAQVESTNNSVALVTRVRSVTESGFELQLQSQEADLDPAATESVGYIAIQTGTGTLDGSPLLVARTGPNITQAWSPLNFGGSYRQPLFFAQAQTRNGADPFSIRRRNLTTSSVEIFLQEEQSADAEVNHAAEDVGFLVFAETQGELRARLEIGTAEISQPSGGAWTAVTFETPYINPVVVFGPVHQGDPEPAKVRVRNVSSTGFEFQIEEWDYQDGIRPLDKVNYLLAEAGSYFIGGKRWVFGKVGGVTHTAAVRTFPDAFAAAPVVIAQVATVKGPAAVVERISNVTATGFTLQLQEEKAADGTHSAEEVHYLAVEKGNGRLAADGVVFEAGATPVNITSSFGKVNLARKFAAPALLADSQTKNEADAIVPRYRDLGLSEFSIRLQEDSSTGQETTHGAEVVGYLVIASEVDEDEDGIANSWELANGLDPNDPNDAQFDPDNDGIPNADEYLYGTNPADFDSGGTVTLEVVEPDAFEKEGTPARIRVNRTGASGPVTVHFTLSGRATPPGSAGADYRTRGEDGGILAGSVTIGRDAAHQDIVIGPIADTLNEYPETVTVTLTSSNRYTIGAIAAATVTINDAAATPENEQLFLAYLIPGNGVQSHASGFATIFLNGPKNAARVSLNFSGLTSTQTNAYIRYGIPSGVGPELRPTLPSGQVTDQVWNISPTGALSGQQIIDALFQVDGKYVYVNVGTGNYPAGEITGTVSRQIGSSTFTPPSAPPAIAQVSGETLRRDVVRFLTQATFGPTQEQIDSLVNAINTTYGGDRIAAYSAWIDAQFTLEQSRLLDLTMAADADEWARRGATPLNYANNNEPRHHNRRRSWWTIAAQAHDQLRQRVAFALSEILVVSDDETVVRQKHYGTAHYYDILADYADRNYRGLLGQVTKSPIMGKYLSHLKNQKAIIDPQTGQVLVSPDENYAREILQLFSIGLVHRHLDGTLKLGVNGLPIPTYTNNDITELARVFTGWSFSKRHGAKGDGYPVLDNSNFNQGNGPAYFQASWTNPLKNFAAYHDSGPKTVLGTDIPGGLGGQAELTIALDTIFAHPNVAPFISRLLIQRFVTSNPSAGYIYRVAQKFEDDGKGARGNLKEVVRAILLDYEARSLDVVNNVGFGKQKEPIIRYIQLIRALGGKSGAPLSQLSAYGYPASQLDNFPAGATLLRYPDTDQRLGQTPQSAPSVFNWFLPDHNPGGDIGSAGLVAPEMQLTTETSAVQAINYHQTLTNADNGQSTQVLINSTDGQEDNVKLDRTPWVALYDQKIAEGKTVAQATEAVLDQLGLLLTAGNFKARYASAPTPNPRSIVLSTVSSLNATSIQRVKELLYLLVTSPEYVHQK